MYKQWSYAALYGLWSGSTQFIQACLYFIVFILYINTLTLIMKTRLFKYKEDFTFKSWKFSNKKLILFHISAQNIDCGYSLELPRCFWVEIRKDHLYMYPCKPQFYYIKVGFNGVKIK